MTDRFEPTCWELLESDSRNWDEFIDPQIRVELVRGFHGKRYAVRKHSFCLSTGGKWDYEPLPSGRTQAWLKRHRFETLEAAMTAAVKAWERETKVRNK